MTKKSTYEELEQRVKELERKVDTQKQIEIELRNVYVLFKAICEHSPFGITIANLDGTHVISNPALREISGYTEEEFKELESDRLTNPEDLEREYPLFQEVIEGKRDSYDIEKRNIHKDGHHYWAQAKVASVRDEEGNVKFLVVMDEDITERKMMEEELQTLWLAVEQSVNGINITDMEGVIRYANPASEEIYGYEPGELVGQHVQVFNPHPKITSSQIIPAIRSKGNWRGELTQKRKDGSQFTAHLSATSVQKDGETIGMLGVVKDITERVKKEKKILDQSLKLKKQSKNLEEVNTALKVLLEHNKDEKTQMELNILNSVKKLIFPYLDKVMDYKMKPEITSLLGIIRSNLEEIVSPFARELSSRYIRLTPTEIKIADLIRQGNSSKEIARILNVSTNVIAVHRYNIRKKLDLLNKKVNLRTYLQNFPFDGDLQEN